MKQVSITLPEEWYENIFNAYEDVKGENDAYTFYNINNKVTLPADIDPQIFEYWAVPGSMPLTTLSHKIYGTMHLWWLIMISNHITNPIKNLAPGSTIRVIKQEYVSYILSNLRKQK